MGVVPLLVALVMSAAAPSSHAPTGGLPAGDEHGVVPLLAPWYVRGRATSKSHLHTDRWFLAGDEHRVVPLLVALVMSAAAPTSKSPHTDRWPFWQAMYMGVVPLLFALVISAAAPTSNSHLHTNRWAFWQATVMGVVPLLVALVMSAAAPPRRAAPTGGPSRRRRTWEAAVVGRLGDVRGRAHLEQPLAPTGGPSSRRCTWE